MVSFDTVIRKFADQGTNTGWTYIVVPLDIAEQLNPKVKRSFRIKGKLNNYSFKGKSLLPFGQGNFMLALNAEMRKGINKPVGTNITAEIEVDNEPIPLSEDLIVCLQDEPKAWEFFNSLPKSHKKYFSDWVESAKTISTKEKRITMSVNALAMHLGFGEMQRANRENSQYQ